MAGFFKKALSVFVEFDEDQQNQTTSSFSQTPKISNDIIRNPLNHVEAEKFEKYFEDFELHMKSIHDNVDERERQLTE